MIAKVCRNCDCRNPARRGKFCTMRCGYLFALKETKSERWCFTCYQWVNDTVRRNCEDDKHAMEAVR